MNFNKIHAFSSQNLGLEWTKTRENQESNPTLYSKLICKVWFFTVLIEFIRKNFEALTKKYIIFESHNMLNQSAGLPPLFLLLCSCSVFNTFELRHSLHRWNYSRKSLRVCVKAIIRPEIFEELETPIEDFHVLIKLVQSEKNIIYTVFP